MAVKITNFSWADTRAETVAVTGDASKIVQRESLVRFTWTAETTAGGLDRFELIVADDEPAVTIPGTKKEYSRHLYDSGRQYVRLRAYDSAGNSAEVGAYVAILPYSAPAVDGSAVRVNNFEAQTKISAAVTVSDLGGQNAASVRYQYREAGAAAYSAAVALADGETAVISLDRDKAWEVLFTVADALETATELVTVAKGRPILFVDVKKRAAALGGFPEHSDALEVPALYLAGAKMCGKVPIYKEATASAAAVSSEGLILVLTLPAGLYLVLGSVNSSIGSTAAQSAILAAGANVTPLLDMQGRGSMYAGGGVTAWGLYRSTGAGKVLLNSYNYHNTANYNWRGIACAIPLDE